ncbi:hypothetical protein N9B39_01895 [bacterium]|nr:hypothetical protein [bacterium]MDB4533050.1 hypothetical protein [bacterium]
MTAPFYLAFTPTQIKILSDYAETLADGDPLKGAILVVVAAWNAK